MVPTPLRILQARGITLWLDGDQVWCRAPKGPLTASDQTLLTAHCAALITWCRQQGAGGWSADLGASLPESPCPPHVPYALLPSDGPLRQCQTCPHVWYVPCACGNTQWQWHVEAEVWGCRACGVWYAAQSTHGCPDDLTRAEAEARPVEEGT
jgi:hypothetical protein